MNKKLYFNNANKENLTWTNVTDDSFKVNYAKDTGVNNISFKCTSGNARNFFTHCGLNQHQRTSLRRPEKLLSLEDN